MCDDGRLRQASFQGLREDKPAREVVREAPVADDEAPAVVAGVRLTHPERVLFPDGPLTKLDLARYYESIADWILPHVAGRPLSLVRCPTGLGSCSDVKHATATDPGVLRRVSIREKDATRAYAVVDELSPKRRSDHFTVANVRRRLGRLKADPWREYWTVRQRLTAKALAAVTGGTRNARTRTR